MSMIDQSNHEISVQELKAKFDNGDVFELIDVREADEYELCNIQPSTLVPLGTISSKLDILDKNKEYVLMCRSGGRSWHATQQFLAHGISNVRNLVGGINQWALEIDTSISPY